MKSKPKPQPQESEQTDGNEFARFDAFVKQVMSVPKEEIDRREAEWQAERAKKKSKRKQG